MLDWIGRICGGRGKALLSVVLIVLLSLGMPARQLIAEETQEQGTEEQSGMPVHLSAPTAFLMEASTGTVIFEQNADVPCSPASITKIMTLLLIFEALKSGDISLQDEVMTSAHAQSMGGSQVFLEEGGKPGFLLLLPSCFQWERLRSSSLRRKLRYRRRRSRVVYPCICRRRRPF